MTQETTIQASELIIKEGDNGVFDFVIKFEGQFSEGQGTQSLFNQQFSQALDDAGLQQVADDDVFEAHGGSQTIAVTHIQAKDGVEIDWAQVKSTLQEYVADGGTMVLENRDGNPLGASPIAPTQQPETNQSNAAAAFKGTLPDGVSPADIADALRENGLEVVPDSYEYLGKDERFIIKVDANAPEESLKAAKEALEELGVEKLEVFGKNGESIKLGALDTAPDVSGLASLDLDKLPVDLNKHNKDGANGFDIDWEAMGDNAVAAMGGDTSSVISSNIAGLEQQSLNKENDLGIA